MIRFLLPCLSSAHAHRHAVIETVGPAIEFIVDLAQDRDCGNGKIVRVDTILDRAEVDASRGARAEGWK